MHFLKGSQQVINQGDDIPNWEEQANKVRRQMSELFDAQNLSFLFGSGCSSMWKDAEEHGIPTMGPLAGEFRSWFEGMPNLTATVTRPQKDQLLAQVGIDLSAGEYSNNLERLMDVLLNAERFCAASTKAELNDSVPLIQEVIAGVKKYVLRKCTTGKFETDSAVVDLYRKFYQSVGTRSRGLRPPWVFTTNYDLFNERALDRNAIPYSNGFTGTVERVFNPSVYRLALAEQLDISSKRWSAVDGFIHLCKLHGSVNWVENEDTGLFPISEKNAPDADDDRVMIYPSPAKQNASFGSPYADMFREFQRQVVQDQSVLVTMGYSFGDEHVNNIIFQSLTIPGFKLVIFLDPDSVDANETTKKLKALGDPRIWFLWGEGASQAERAHYFSNIVADLLPSNSEDTVTNSIENAMKVLMSKTMGAPDEG
jgi:hypothetical protein